jgi:hypothetical protein
MCWVAFVKTSITIKNYDNLKWQKKNVKVFSSAHNCPMHSKYNQGKHIMFKLRAWYDTKKIMSRAIKRWETCMPHLDVLWGSYAHLKLWAIICFKIRNESQKHQRLIWLQCSPLKVTMKYNTRKKMVVPPKFKSWANLVDLN